MLVAPPIENKQKNILRVFILLNQYNLQFHNSISH